MKEIYLIRHTTPDILPGICYGASDIDVNHIFEAELSKIKSSLKSFNPEYIYSSPLIRCHKLANSLYINENITFDDRLLEMNFGDWELKRWDQIDRTIMDKWSSDFVNTATPNGENFNDLYVRVNDFWNNKIHTLPSASKASIITHSGVIRCLLSRFLSIPLGKIFRLKLNYGAIIKITLYPDFEEVEMIKNNIH